MTFVVIFVGGAAGALARFVLFTAMQRRSGPRFPWGTLTANVAGSFLLGCALPLFAYDDEVSWVEPFAIVGVLGAFTTFSTFANEAVALWRAGRPGAAVLYMAATITIGLVAMALGLAVADPALGILPTR